MNHFDIVQRLCESGYPAYLVGVCCRDLILGIDPHDFDITTKATPDQIAEVFSGYNVNLVGKSFGVTLVEGYEVATFRIDRQEVGGAKNCEVEYAETIFDDLSRRDLTFNAFCICPVSGDVIDPHGGVADLRDRVVKFVGNPDERIYEDPARIIRAARFLAKIEGVFDYDTLKALQRNAAKVREIAPERLRDEVLKAMELDKPSLFFAALYVIGALDFVFPGLSKAVDHDHGHHHKENVWEHLMAVGDAVSPRFPIVRLGGYLHDAGKPSAFAYHNDGSFVGHECIGAKVVDGWLKRLRFSTQERETIVNLVSTHMIGGYKEMTPKAIRKFRKTLFDLGVNPSDWIRIRIADRRGNLNRDGFNAQDIRRLVELFKNTEEPAVFDVNTLALRGGDIIHIFNLKPSKVVGDTQKHLLNFVLENGFEFNTFDVLADEAARFLSERV